jgi:hypothetical protein
MCINKMADGRRYDRDEDDNRRVRVEGISNINEKVLDRDAIYKYTGQILFFDDSEEQIRSIKELCKNIEAIHVPRTKIIGIGTGYYGWDKYNRLDEFEDNGYARIQEDFVRMFRDDAIISNNRDELYEGIISKGLTEKQMASIIAWSKDESISNKKCIFDFDRTLSIFEGALLTHGQTYYNDNIKPKLERYRVSDRDKAVYIFGRENRFQKLKEMFIELDKNIGSENIYVMTANTGISSVGGMSISDIKFNKQRFVDVMLEVYPNFRRDNLISSIIEDEDAEGIDGFSKYTKGVFMRLIFPELCNIQTQGGEGRKRRRLKTRKRNRRKVGKTRKNKLGRRTSLSRKVRKRKRNNKTMKK